MFDGAQTFLGGEESLAPTAGAKFVPDSDAGLGVYNCCISIPYCIAIIDQISLFVTTPGQQSNRSHCKTPGGNAITHWPPRWRCPRLRARVIHQILEVTFSNPSHRNTLLKRSETWNRRCPCGAVPGRSQSSSLIRAN